MGVNRPETSHEKSVAWLHPVRLVNGEYCWPLCVMPRPCFDWRGGANNGIRDHHVATRQLQRKNTVLHNFFNSVSVQRVAAIFNLQSIAPPEQRSGLVECCSHYRRKLVLTLESLFRNSTAIVGCDDLWTYHMLTAVMGWALWLAAAIRRKRWGKSVTQRPRHSSCNAARVRMSASIVPATSFRLAGPLSCLGLCS